MQSRGSGGAIDKSDDHLGVGVQAFAESWPCMGGWSVQG